MVVLLQVVSCALSLPTLGVHELLIRQFHTSRFVRVTLMLLTLASPAATLLPPGKAGFLAKAVKVTDTPPASINTRVAANI